MILRGASLSQESRQVGVVRVEAVPAVKVPEPTPLSVESIISWLARSSASQRAQVAGYLATDIESLRLEAQTDGFESGRARGLQETKARMETSVSLLESVVSAARQALDREAAQLADLCTDIIVEALTKIAGPILASREAAIGAVVKILERVKEDCELLIKVNQADLPLLQELEGTLRKALAGRSFSLAADDSVSLGGCIVGSQLGTFDARMEVQLAGLLESIRGAREVGA
jgi:flagellar assembly protein FliH